MSSNITANIHSINTLEKTCVISIYDGDSVIVDNNNMHLELNSDNTANTIWLKQKIKNKVADYRFYVSEDNAKPKISIPPSEE